ncbi:MAG: hypothetical protein HYY34_07815 [Chloroflexi bacterium]|nr:hypothetical protein [Chloroflexota bacterium]
MNCCQCQGIEQVFNAKVAARELRAYRKKGPRKTTRLLIDALKAEGVDGLTLLDIGGSIGKIQHELLDAGAARALIAATRLHDRADLDQQARWRPAPTEHAEA